MVDKISGQVAYAVMSFGGFISIGESSHPLVKMVVDSAFLTLDVIPGQ
jgi:hypothetical protein